MLSSSGVARSANSAKPERMSTTSARAPTFLPLPGSLVGRLLPDDRVAHRLVYGPRDAGGIEAVLAQDVGGLAVGQKRIGQRERADAPGEAVRRQRLEDRAPEAAGTNVVLD